VISKRCDTKDWSNDAEFSFDITVIHYIWRIEKYFKLQIYFTVLLFCCIFDQINSLGKHKILLSKSKIHTDPKRLEVSVYICPCFVTCHVVLNIDDTRDLTEHLKKCSYYDSNYVHFENKLLGNSLIFCQNMSFNPTTQHCVIQNSPTWKISLYLISTLEHIYGILA